MNLADTEYKVINYGDRMLEIAREKDLVDNRDEMKELGVEEYKEIQKEAAESIYEDAEDDDVIVDTHAAIKSPHGYIPGLPEWTLKNLDPAKIIMIRAEPEELWERVEDDDRDREHDSKREIEDYQNVAREMAATGSVLTGAYLKVIENPDGEAHTAAQELLETLRA
jgi:adenylate kinase